jgi:hypothetical protein
MTNPATWEAEAEGAQVPGPSGPSSEALTQKIKKERKKERKGQVWRFTPAILIAW